MGIITNPYISFPPSQGKSFNTTLGTNLLGCWELNETSGTTAYDETGNYDLTNNSLTPNQTTAILGTSYRSTAITNSLTYNTGIFADWPFSYSFWFYRASTSVSFLRFVHSHWDPSNYIGTWLSHNGAAFALHFGDGTGIGTADRYTHLYNYSLSNSTWYNVVVTSSGRLNSQNNIYVNGNSVNYTSTSGGASSTNWTNGGYFGMLCPTNYTSLDGYIDQFAIWDKVLDSTEIEYLYNSGNGFAYDGW